MEHLSGCKLVKEYSKQGLNVKIYAPDITEEQSLIKKVRIKERLLHIINDSDKKGTPRRW